MRKKLPSLLEELPDLAVVQEATKNALTDLPVPYESRWLGGEPGQGLALLYRHNYSINQCEVATSGDVFVKVDVEGPLNFRLIAAWNCKGAGASYIANLHLFLDEHADWFDSAPLIFAGDLNVEPSLSNGKRKIARERFESRLRSFGLVDAYSATRPVADKGFRDATYRHRWDSEQPFHIDFIYVPSVWLPAVSTITVGSAEKWSHLSDHSPVILSIADKLVSPVTADGQLLK